MASFISIGTGVAHAEILSPATINGAFATGGDVIENGTCTTNNLGGSTANTNNTANLNGLGAIGPYNFNVTASVVRGTASNAVWANGVCFPTANAIRFQTTKVPTTAVGADGPGYGNYEFSFSQAVGALRFRVNGVDYEDYVEIFAYNGVTQVAVLASYMTPDAGLTYYVPFVNRFTGGATDGNAVGYLSPGTSGALGLVVNFPLATKVTRVVVRYGKAGGTILNATSFFSDFSWDVETKVRTRKISNGAIGTFAFSAATNLASIPANIATTSAGVAAPPSPAAIKVSTSGTAVTITEALAPGYSVTGFSCADANMATTGNPTSFGTFVAATRVGTIPAANVRPGADMACQFTNTLIPPAMSIVKSRVLVKAPGNTNANAQLGDTINYTYVVTNTGGQVITNVEVSDIHSGAGSFADPNHTTLIDNGTTGNSPDTNPNATIWGTFAPQDVLSFATSYVVVQQDIDAQ